MKLREVYLIICDIGLLLNLAFTLMGFFPKGEGLFFGILWGLFAFSGLLIQDDTGDPDGEKTI